MTQKEEETYSKVTSLMICDNRDEKTSPAFLNIWDNDIHKFHSRISTREAERILNKFECVLHESCFAVDDYKGTYSKYMIYFRDDNEKALFLLKFSQ